MKKTFTLRTFGLAILLIAVLACLTGCQNDTPRHLAIVYAACENNPVPAAGGQLYEAISETTNNFGSTMSIFVADSSNFRSFHYEFEKPSMNVSDSRETVIKRNYTSMAFKALSEAEAQADEVDLLGTVSQAARQLLSDKKDKEKTEMIVIASGLSTVSPLDFTKGYLFCTPDEVVERVRSKNALPDLSFLDSVVLLGVGDVTAPQEKLSAHQVKDLKAIWKAIFEAAGCSHVTFAPDLTENSQKQHTYSVKTVDVGIDPDPDLTKVNYIGSLEFKAFKTEFVTEPEEIKTILHPYAEYLKRHETKRVLLAGMTDHYGNNDTGNMMFSMKRAAAVRQVLVDEFNINPDQIVICGLGYTDHPWRFRDEDGNELHSANRATIIVDADSEPARLFLRIGVHE